MNVLLCREVEFINPFKHKERTKERGRAWEEVAFKLQSYGHDVTRRSVRDRYKTIKDSVTRRNNLEKKQSGIAPEVTDEDAEITQIVEDLVEIETDTKEQQSEEEKKQLDGVDIRKRALESFTETKKR